LPTEEKHWGAPMNEPADKNTESPPKPVFSIAAGDYEVVRGDALVKISKKAGITVDQLMRFNELTGDLIRIGQILKIPTLEDVLAMAPPPVAKVVQEESLVAEKFSALPQIKTLEDLIAEATLHQVFLDRENFSIGPIDGDRGTIYEQTLVIYQSMHEDLRTPEALREKAVAVAERPFASYRLKRSDFRFIEAPKELIPPSIPPRKSRKGSKSRKAPIAPPPTYEELVAAEFSAYRTAWEFVAERFHCDETFLRNLNPKIKSPPPEGTEFKVPNVIPFEVENCFAGPLQPAADPDKPVTATIVGLSRLEIRRGDKLLAVMPVSRARPGLRGKGTWTILAAIPGPRLATRQEPRSAPLSNDSGVLPAAEQFLAAGPRNPVGIYWIDLAKSDSTTPLPYGLHGTSIPGRVKTCESIGGFRLANWDIARAVRLLPEGTPLQWK
jgi:LysM repeat protein/lipoprotein-anchoring transpeptidase ErfK/SrfK